MLNAVNHESCGRVFWVHHLGLRLPDDYQAAYADNIIFVWDDELFQQQDYSLKKLVFIYETLCALPVTIIRGNTLTVLTNLAAKEIITWQTPDPYLLNIINMLKQKSVPISILATQPFVLFNPDQNLKRFFQYWNKVQKKAMQIDGGA